MAIFQIGDKVKISKKFWNNKKPQPQGVVTGTFSLAAIIEGAAASNERQFECAFRDHTKCSVGYNVLWENGCENPWSEIELTPA